MVGQYSKLAKIPFPGKKTFGNLERNVVEKRKKMLSEFLTILLGLETTDYPGLYEQIFTFLSPGWEAQKSNVVVQAVTAVSQAEWSTLIGRDHRDTVFSLAESYYAGAKVYGLCHSNTPQGMHFEPVFLWHDKWLPCTERIFYRHPYALRCVFMA